MLVHPDQLIGLYRGLVNEDPRERSQHADSVTDVYRGMSNAELRSVGSLLAALAVWESDAAAR